VGSAAEVYHYMLWCLPRFEYTVPYLYPHSVP
jgi:hypothetical protein